MMIPDSRGLFTAVFSLGALVGSLIGLIGLLVIPWLWRIVKPWLHAVTA